jgi:hypothetical protein
MIPMRFEPSTAAYKTIPTPTPLTLELHKHTNQENIIRLRYMGEARGLGFGTGIPRVGIFHTVPVPANTVPITGTGTYRTVICAVSHGYHANPWDI